MSEDKGAPAASDLGVPAARAQADAQGPATAGPSAKMKHTLQNVKLPIRGLNNRRWEAECEAQVSRMTEYLTRRAMNGDCRGRILEFLNPSGPAVAPFLNLEEQEDFEAKVDAEHRRAGHAIRISGLGRPGVRELRTTFGNHVGPVDQVFFNEVQDKTIGKEIGRRVYPIVLCKNAPRYVVFDDPMHAAEATRILIEFGVVEQING